MKKSVLVEVKSLSGVFEYYETFDCLFEASKKASQLVESLNFRNEEFEDSEVFKLTLGNDFLIIYKDKCCKNNPARESTEVLWYDLRMCTWELWQRRHWSTPNYVSEVRKCLKIPDDYELKNNERFKKREEKVRECPF